MPSLVQQTALEGVFHTILQPSTCSAHYKKLIATPLLHDFLRANCLHHVLPHRLLETLPVVNGLLRYV